MSLHPDPRILAFSGIGFYGFFWGFGKLKEKWLIENIPTSTIRGMAMGMVELTGSAACAPAGPLKSPLCGVDCVYYRFLVERKVSSGKSSHWETVEAGSSDIEPFFLDDGTGVVQVRPMGAEHVMPVDFEETTGLGRPCSERMAAFMDSTGHAYKGLFGIPETLRFREWYIEPGKTVYVLGTVKEYDTETYDFNRPAAAGSWPLEEKYGQERLPRCVVWKGDDEKPTFIVSDESQTQILDTMGWQIVLGIYGGAALAVGALALFLIDGGWLRF